MSEIQLDPPPRVVVGVDGSEHSKQALRWAAHFAASAGARIEAITAWQFPVAYGWSPMPMDWNPRPDMEKVLTQTVDEVFGTERPANMRLSVQEGNPTHILIHESKGALMLVVGSRGHGGFAGLLLGSVSANVAQHAGCSVLIVHGDEPIPTAAS